MKTHILTFVLGLAALGISTAAIAQPSAPATVTPATVAAATAAPTMITHTGEQAAELSAKAEKWLQELKTARARFLLTAGNGSQLTGTFYLNRPGKLRFDYDDPVKDFIVADGVFIYFYDANLGEQSNAPIGSTLADFILRDKIRLSGDVKVDSVTESAGLVQIRLTQANDSGAGSLTLGFTREPFQLKKWRVVDPQGSISEVELFQMQTGIPLDRRMFYYHNPQQTPGALNK